MKIGFFDSGAGGLFIMNAVRTLMPEYDYLYLGDTKNVPYGSKTREEIHTHTKEGIEELYKRGASLVIVACNTASVEALPILQEDIHGHYYEQRRILGVVIPTVESLIESGCTRIHLIGTERTVRSKKYEQELLNRKSGIAITTEATPELVPLIEAGNLDDAETHLIGYLDPWVGEVDGVLLGCTHYGLLKGSIRTRYGEKIRVFSQDEIIPDKLKQYLDRHTGLRDNLTRGSTQEVIWTGATPEIADRLLN
jgi:glutamate racemase